VAEQRDDSGADLRVGGWLPGSAGWSPELDTPEGEPGTGYRAQSDEPRPWQPAYPPAGSPPSEEDPFADGPPDYTPPAPGGYRAGDEPQPWESRADEPRPWEHRGPAAAPDAPFDPWGSRHPDPAAPAGLSGSSGGLSSGTGGGRPDGFDAPPGAVARGGSDSLDGPSGAASRAGFDRLDDPSSAVPRAGFEPLDGPSGAVSRAGFDSLDGPSGAAARTGAPVDLPTEPLAIPAQRITTSGGSGRGGRPGDPHPAHSSGARRTAGAVAGAAAAGAAGAGRAGGPGRATATARRRSTPGANDITQQLKMIPAAIAELPPVSLRGMPMFLAILMALGAIGIIAIMNVGDDAKPAPVPTVDATPTLGMPTIAPVPAIPLPTGAVPSAATTTSAAATTSSPAPRPSTSSAKSPTRVLLGALGNAQFNDYCQYRQSGGARLSKPATGTNAAIDNWYCTGERRNKSFTIVPNLVCQWKYGSNSYAAYLDANDAYSWRCYR
jgi:hypothetical protein